MYLKIEPEACELTNRDEETQISEHSDRIYSETDGFLNNLAEIMPDENQ